MTAFQRSILVFALFYVAAMVFGLHYHALPSADLSVFFGLAVAGTLGGLLYLRAQNLKAAWIAFALGGLGCGYTIQCRALDTSSPNHLIHFARDPFYRDETEPALYTEAYGCIGEDPDVRTATTFLTLDPDFLVEMNQQGQPVRKVPIDSGRIVARASRQLALESSFQELAYGDRILTRETELLRPPAPDNPNTFDFRSYLRSVGAYATMDLRAPMQIRKLSDRDATALGLPPCGNAFSRFALELRRSFTLAIKSTIPYPESSFTGGVLIGLRGGMDTKPYEELREPFLGNDLSLWQKVKRAFGDFGLEPGTVPTNAVAVYQATGTAHILAVSGLHVTIIATLCFAVLSALRVPRQLLAFGIVPAIWIFTILVGFRPATMRSATMTSIVAISFSLLGSGLRASSLFGLAVSAIVVLAFYPIAVTEASVTYSFGAILSLALLTNPIDQYLRRYVRDLFGYAVMILAYTALSLAVLGQLSAWPPSPVLQGVLGMALAGLLLRGRLPLDLSFGRLPVSVSTFISAQLAILAGLVLPLNTYYFQQFPISSPLGNVIALPGLTLVIFASMLSVLLFLIPFVGPPLALLLMAGNWFFIKYLFFPPLVILFWLFPLPAVQPPTGQELLVYYGLLGLLAWNQDIRKLLHRLIFRLLDLLRAPHLNRSLTLATLLVGVAALALLATALQPQYGPTRLSVLHPHNLGRGGGHPLLVQAPWGESVLIDGGPRTITSRANKRARSPFDVGERIVADVLLGQHLSRLDTIVITNFRQESFGGLMHLLEHFDVKRVVDPIGPDLPVDVSYEEFLKALGDDRVYEDRKSNRILEIHETYLDYRRICQRRGIPILKASADLELLHPEWPVQRQNRGLWLFPALTLLGVFLVWRALQRRRMPLRSFDLLVLGGLLVLLCVQSTLRAFRQAPEASLKIVAPLESRKGPGALESNSLVLRLETQQGSALLPADLQAEDQARLLQQLPPEKLRADILVIPDRAQPGALHQPFLAAVRPQTALAINHLDKTNRAAVGTVLDAYAQAGADVYLTQECGAVLLRFGQQPQPVIETVRPCRPSPR